MTGSNFVCRKKKKEFTHFPCWEVVKSHQTFARTETSTPPSYIYEASPPDVEVPPNVSIEDLTFSTPESHPGSSSSPVRPPGVKAAKEAKRKGKQSATMSMQRRDDVFESMAKNQKEYIDWQKKLGEEEAEIHREEVKVQRDALNLKKLEEETKVMQMDTESMTPMSKKYFTKRKATILQQYEDDDDQGNSNTFSNCYRPLHFDP